MFSMYIYQCIRISSIVLGIFLGGNGGEGRRRGRRGLWLDILVKISFPWLDSIFWHFFTRGQRSTSQTLIPFIRLSSCDRHSLLRRRGPRRSSKDTGGYSKDFLKSLESSGVFVSGVLLGIVWRGKGCGPRGARLCG